MSEIARALLFAFLVTSPSAWAAEPALDYKISIASDVVPELRDKLQDIVRSALMVVEEFPPNGYDNNLFHWSSDRAILDGKSLTFFLATTKNPTIAPHLGAFGMGSYTMAPINTTKKTMAIFVVLLVDKIFYDSSGHEQHHNLAKLIVSLAHEIYGNVQRFLESDMIEEKPQTTLDRVSQRRKAARASLMFLGGLRNNPRFALIPEEVREGLMSLLPSEIKTFRSLNEASLSLGVDPDCVAVLTSLEK